MIINSQQIHMCEKDSCLSWNKKLALHFESHAGEAVGSQQQCWGTNSDS